MARLALIFNILDNAHRADLQQRQKRRRIARYTKNTFSVTDEEFKQNYGVTKDLFEVILADLEPLMKKPGRRSDISSKYKVLAALSFYSTGGYQRLVGGPYGTVMSQQSVSRVIKEVTAALNTEVILNKWLKFPQTLQERHSLKISFYKKYRIPSIVGCIDGTHVSIIRPTQNEEQFYNHRGYHSKNVLIICDADLNILSVDASFGGATHNSVVWNQHPVKDILINLNNAEERVFLLGDSGYPQREYLMTPIYDAPLSSPEEYYTKLHSTAHTTVDRTISMLKNTWRCLLNHRALHYHPDTATKIINACCVLHNICNGARQHQDDNEDMPVPPSTAEYFQEADSTELRKGIECRASLVEDLWGARDVH